jgi:hypothetical protein
MTLRILRNAVLLALLPTCVSAQIRGSERGEITQVVNGTKISIDYGRPHVRGRTMLGDEIGWGHVWTPGANLATTIEFSKDAHFVGVPVAAGRYSMWMIPAEGGEWEVVLDPNAELYHTQPPERHDGQIVVVVQPQEAALREALTFTFTLVEPSGTDLEMAWERVVLPLRIDVEAKPIPTMTESEAAPYLGGYEMAPPPGAPLPPGMPPLFVAELALVDGRMIWSIPTPEGPSESMLIPAAEHIFQLGLMLDGELFEVEQDMYFEFHVEDGVVVGLDVRGLEDALMVSGKKVGPRPTSDS